MSNDKITEEWEKEFKRKLELEGGVFIRDDYTMSRWLDNMPHLESAMLHARKTGTLSSYINSYGGDGDYFRAFRLCIEEFALKNPNVTLRSRISPGGSALSAAGFTFLLANVREMFTDSRFGVHYPKWGNAKDPTKKQLLHSTRLCFEIGGFARSRQNLEERNSDLLDFFCSRTGLDHQYADSLFRADRVLCAQEAYELGIATHLLKVPRSSRN
jgi:hypothetical protein